MDIRTAVLQQFTQQLEGLQGSEAFQALENGQAGQADYDALISNICRVHLKSPHILAFLFSIAPPKVSDKIKDNMLEEMGLDEGGVPHPEMLIKLAKAAGFDDARCRELEELALQETKRRCNLPIPFKTLKELGLSAFLETVAFEWILSRVSSRMGSFLEKHRSLSKHNLEWFFHHSEVDIRHAEEGIDAIEEYVRYYEFDENTVNIILEMTFRDNIFVAQYFA